MAGTTDDVPVGVVGAGTMGSGIAQVISTAGRTVVLIDEDAGALERSRLGLETIAARLTEKGRWSKEEAQQIRQRIHYSTSITDANNAGLVIEAIVEDLAAKQNLFASLESVLAGDCTLATNTSSLSVTEIARACSRPERVVGLHFFNPAPLLPLVEVVPGLQTAATIVSSAIDETRAWGKTPVLARDLPGFIVNRVARPFYSEALRILDEGLADHAFIDRSLRDVHGFRMGPFELMDLIGNDINYAVTKTVYEAFYHEPRYRPSVTQFRMVQAGRLGRKSGRGYYRYEGGARVDETTMAKPPPDDSGLARMVADRILAMLMNEAADAVFWNVASVADIDLAMTAGVNYPKGLLRWIDEAGAAWVLERLASLQSRYKEERYRPSPILSDMAERGGRFHG